GGWGCCARVWRLPGVLPAPRLRSIGRDQLGPLPVLGAYALGIGEFRARRRKREAILGQPGDEQEERVGEPEPDDDAERQHATKIRRGAACCAPTLRRHCTWRADHESFGPWPPSSPALHAAPRSRGARPSARRAGRLRPP